MQKIVHQVVGGVLHAADDLLDDLLTKSKSAGSEEEEKQESIAEVEIPTNTFGKAVGEKIQNIATIIQDAEPVEDEEMSKQGSFAEFAVAGK